MPKKDATPLGGYASEGEDKKGGDQLDFQHLGDQYKLEVLQRRVQYEWWGEGCVTKGAARRGTVHLRVADLSEGRVL